MVNESFINRLNDILILQYVKDSPMLVPKSTQIVIQNLSIVDYKRPSEIAELAN